MSKYAKKQHESHGYQLITKDYIQTTELIQLNCQCFQMLTMLRTTPIYGRHLETNLQLTM